MTARAVFLGDPHRGRSPRPPALTEADARRALTRFLLRSLVALPRRSCRYPCVFRWDVDTVRGPGLARGGKPCTHGNGRRTTLLLLPACAPPGSLLWSFSLVRRWIRREFWLLWAQAMDVADRLGLMPPVMEQPEYNMFERKKVRVCSWPNINAMLQQTNTTETREGSCGGGRRAGGEGSPD